jgi:hypothetical protein
MPGRGADTPGTSIVPPSRKIGGRNAKRGPGGSGKAARASQAGDRGDTAWQLCFGTDRASDSSARCGFRPPAIDGSDATTFPSDVSAMIQEQVFRVCAQQRFADGRADNAVRRLPTSSTARIFSASLSFPIQRSLRRCLSVRSSANWSVATSGSLVRASIGLIDTLPLRLTPSRCEQRNGCLRFSSPG